MRPKPSKSPKISRRGLLQSGLAPVATPLGSTLLAPLHPFESWRTEWLALEGELDRMPEEQDDDSRRDRLFDRIFERVHLILNTPSTDLPAIQVKAATLVWLMEMEFSDGLPAIRHIQSFLATLRQG